MSETPMCPSLWLDDGGDLYDVTIAIENAFGFMFAEAELLSIRTVGDVLAIVRSRFPAAMEADGRCPISMAFYRVRRGLLACGYPAAIGPGTALAEAGQSPRRLKQALSKSLNLRLPDYPQSFVGNGGALLVLLSFVAVAGSWLLVAGLWPVFVATGLAGAVLLRIDRGLFREHYATASSLSRAVAAMNLGRLHEEGATLRDADLWDALAAIFAEYSTVPAQRIRPDTLICSAPVSAKCA